jgi:glutaredoxin-like protein
MALLGPADRDTVRQHLSSLTHPVSLVFFSQTLNEPESASITRQILREMAELNDLIKIEEANYVLDKERAESLGISGIPAIAIMREGTDTRMRFLGAPAGYEFMSLVEAIMLAGTDEPILTDANRQLVEGVSQPTDIKVFVTPTCPHCPRAVTLAHKMAMVNPLITATCVEATEFMDLSRQYRVTGVPKTVVNGEIEIMGAMPEDDFVRAVLQEPEATAGPQP